MTTHTQKYLLRMNDGRQFTDYTPRGSAPLPATRVPAHERKNEMIARAEDIIRADRERAAASVGAKIDDEAALAAVPGFEITQACDTRSCSFASTVPIPGQPDNTGIGTKTAVASGPP